MLLRKGCWRSRTASLAQQAVAVLPFPAQTHVMHLQVAIMHAYIDLHSSAGLTIDAALRKLLKGFQLPGKLP